MNWNFKQSRDPERFTGENDAVGVPRWREVRSGKMIGLRRSDYEASDWEVIP